MSTRSPGTDAVFERRLATALDQPSRLQLVLAAGHAAETGTWGKNMAPDAKTLEEKKKQQKERDERLKGSIESMTEETLEHEIQELRGIVYANNRDKKKQKARLNELNIALLKKKIAAKQYQERTDKETEELKENMKELEERKKKRSFWKRMTTFDASYDFDLDDEDYVPF